MTRARALRPAAALTLTVLLAAGCAPSGTASRPSGSGPSLTALARPHPTAASRANVATSGTVTSTALPAGARDRAAASRTRRARAVIAHLTRRRGRHAVSVAAVDLRTGVRFMAGARAGMTVASTAKLAILEMLLLRAQRHHRALTVNERALATRMIENSDNEAANELWVGLGAGPALRRAEPALRMRHTAPGDGIDWGLSRSNAPDFVGLLGNLVTSRLLTHRSRHVALYLMSHLEDDQRWGVSAAADRDTVTYNKNGWLGVGRDDGRWATNSVGIVRVHGHRVLMAIFAQHGPGFASGVHLVERLARISAWVVR